MDKPRLIAPKEVAKLACLSKQTICRLTAEGKFPKAVRLSPSRIAYDREQVEAWIEAKLQQVAA